MILTTRPATRRDVEWMIPRLRPEDKRELETATGMPVEVALPHCLESSAETYTWRLEEDGKVAVMPSVLLGVTPDPDHTDVGIVWLLATSDISRAPLSILREAGAWMDAWCERFYGGIHNIVDLRNELHVRWLTLLGCRFGGIVEVNGQPFQHFTRVAPECVTPSV